MRFAFALGIALSASAAFAAEKEQPLSPYEWQQAQKVALDRKSVV